MDPQYSIKFLQILSSIVLAGLVVFLFPNAELPSYITITIGVFLSAKGEVLCVIKRLYT